MTPKDEIEIRNLVGRIRAEADKFIDSGWAPQVLAGALVGVAFSLLTRTYSRAAAVQILRDHLAGTGAVGYIANRRAILPDIYRLHWPSVGSIEDLRGRRNRIV